MAGRWWLSIGALLAGVSVALGAYAAHGLRPLASKGEIEVHRAEVCETAVREQMTHAVGLMLAGLVIARSTPRCFGHAAAICFFIGICLFCGGLYGYAFTGDRDWTRAAPWGGTTMIVGWFLLALAATRCRLAPPDSPPRDDDRMSS